MRARIRNIRRYAVVGAIVATALFTHAAQLAPGNIKAADLTPLGRVETPAGAPIEVVTNGAPAITIFASEAHVQATWLAEVIERMTGVKVPVKRMDTNFVYMAGKAIYIGDCAAARASGIKRPGTPNARWGVGAHAFRCATKYGNVFILGANASVTSYGVYDFAERVLGVRQYYWVRGGKTKEEQAKTRAIGEDVIKTDGLALPQFDWSDKPVYEFRTEFAAGHPGWKFGDAHQSVNAVHTPDHWHMDPNLNYNGRWSSCRDIFEMNSKGKRGTSSMLCYGNPKTLAIYKQHIKRRINGQLVGFSGDPVNLDRKVVSVSQADGEVVCHCDYCKKLRDPSMAPSGDASPIIWGYFTKELAKWMKKEYPDWRISILPYINTCDVPKGLDLTKEGNVDPMLCTMPGLALLAQDKCRKHEEDLMRQWQKATGNPVQNWHYICWPADRTSAPYVFGSTAIKFYREMKGVICGSFLNGGYPVDRLGLSAYVWVRAMWNPNFEAKAVYDEFAKRMFGPAAEKMRQVIDMQEKGWERQWKHVSVASKNIFGASYPRVEVETMERLINESKALVKGIEPYESRLNYYAKPFELFFKESWEYANNKAFPPLLMRKAGELPKLDGVLDDECWKLAETSRPFVNETGPNGNGSTNTVSRWPTTAKAIWTPEGVVIGVNCTDVAPDGIVTNGPAGIYWRNDALEIFIDFSAENAGVFSKLWIDAANQLTFFEKRRPEGVKSGAAITKTGWSCEIFIPFSGLGAYKDAQKPEGASAAGRKWTGNICRLRMNSKVPGWELQRLNTRLSNWNNDVNAFGEWKFVEQ